MSNLEIEEIEDDEEIFEETNDILDEPALQFQIIHQHEIEIEGKKGTFQLATSGIRNIIQSIEPYYWNRPKNEEHVKYLEGLIKKGCHLIGAIKIIKGKSGKYYGFDGQHRGDAYKNVLATDPDRKINPLVHLEIYTFPGEKNIKISKIAKYLFEKSNNLHTFIPERDAIDSYYTEVIAALIKSSLIFAKNILDTPCSRPKLEGNKLYQALKEHYKPRIRPGIPELVSLIKLKNNEISLMPKEKLIKGIICTTANFDKAVKSGCFLNLGTYPLEKWIKELF